jgi:hypothetical protein
LEKNATVGAGGRLKQSLVVTCLHSSNLLPHENGRELITGLACVAIPGTRLSIKFMLGK